MRDIRFNFHKTLPPDAGCRACNCNEFGECTAANGKEIPFTYSLHNSIPKWCPKHKVK